MVVEVALDQDAGDLVPLLGLLHGERAHHLGHFLAPEEQLDGDRVARVVELDLGERERHSDLPVFPLCMLRKSIMPIYVSLGYHQAYYERRTFEAGAKRTSIDRLILIHWRSHGTCHSFQDLNMY